MFDKLKAAAGVAGLLKDLPRVQARLLEVKEEHFGVLGRTKQCFHSVLGPDAEDAGIELETVFSLCFSS